MPPATRPTASAAGGHQLARHDRHTEARQLLKRPIARVRRRVGDKAQRQPSTAKALDSLHGAGDRLLLDVQHAVEIDQQRGHILKHFATIADHARRQRERRPHRARPARPVPQQSRDSTPKPPSPTGSRSSRTSRMSPAQPFTAPPDPARARGGRPAPRSWAGATVQRSESRCLQPSQSMRPGRPPANRESKSSASLHCSALGAP